MRKIVEYTLVSADGIVLDDPFPFRDYLDQAYLQDRLSLFQACDASLWGRTTYERFAKRSTLESSPSPYRARLDELPKYVASSTLRSATWGTSTILRGDALAEVRALKAQGGGDLIILGHGRLSEAMMQNGLIDELILTIHPVFVGQGKPLARDAQIRNLELMTAKQYSSLVRLSYRLLP
jgi:dihydrofolate reductase